MRFPHYWKPSVAEFDDDPNQVGKLWIVATGAVTMVAEAEEVQRLVSEWQAGVDREESFRLLFERFYRPVYRFFEKRSFSTEESHDLTEETFIRVYKGMAAFRHEARFDTWLFQIAANTFRKALRGRSALKRTGETISLETAPVRDDLGAESDDLSKDGTEQGPLDAVLKNEQTRVLRKAIESLPRQMRRCVTLRVYQELSYQEVAILLQLSVETVKAHLFQARQWLRAELSSYFGEIDV